MNFSPLTFTISLCLGFAFLVFFLSDQARARLRRAEVNPLRSVGGDTPVAAHTHRHDRCGCHDGSRPACPGCLKRAGLVGRQGISSP